MDNDTDSGESFEIVGVKEIPKSRVIITPLKYVLRDSFEVSESAHHQLFESQNFTLQSNLDNEIILVARYQERESRSKRLVCIERLSTTLFSAIHGLVTSVAVLDALSHHADHSPALFHGNATLTFDNVDWWKPFDGNNSQSVNISNPILRLELGLQPVIESADLTGSTPSFEVLMEELQKAYYDCLFLSKASLVFFVKITLPKVRQKLDDYGYSLSNYVAFVLASLVPSLPDLDLRYKSALPDFIKTELSETTTSQCTFPFMETTALRNWIALCLEASSHQSAELIVTQRLPPIKAREYQLIVILLLEVLAIRDEQDSETISSPHDFEKSPCNVQDPLILIDVLIDRLGILQSLEFLKNEDPLKTFCLEVIQPFYSSRIPTVVASLHQKCVPQDLLTFDVPPTPRGTSKRKSSQAKDTKSSRRSENSASLKRTKSAPASLLSGKRPAVKKRSLGREVSMSKRAPSFEMSQVKIPALKRSTTFEEKRRLKVEQNTQERVQVGQTPAKDRVHDLNLSKTNSILVNQLSIASHSKASFMAIGETPTKDGASLHSNIAETPGLASCTPTRKSDRVFQAPVDGVHDTPLGRSILFKLDSPSVPLHENALAKLGTVDASPFGVPTKDPFPTLKKSVTFGGFHDPSDKDIIQKQELMNIFHQLNEDEDACDERLDTSHRNLFGNEIVARRKSLSTAHDSRIADCEDTIGADQGNSTKDRTLADELDWL
ncbi:DNA replication regulator sld3 [Taphrina deformans PYCC 5710]|uniref:DNA replication regulator sld3 n=1 Tax=Taphrina deformans (strain PYCC 5710 / ATCC 11124 / CBS 356.35 / IMI 108563 / JCM 9778 / NBRC 8474) TaxID=1097556 RepID=R4XC10_TAPDE|nr:DNA replication regulator sld3 [Taphrina deformans PYCC 5710]|eukprot:CCG81916.1 DNA replication regulator sld3 [Taphrina deformans PYCC 5710]